MPSLLPHQNESTTLCDRRFSRTARHMIKTQILPIVRHYLKDHKISIPPSTNKMSALNRLPTKIFDDSVGDTLALAITNSSCPLNPELDYFRDLERSVLKSLPLSIKRSQRQSVPHWFKCELCGKVFATRYYVDLHQMNHHAKPMNDNQVCLGETLCKALGGCDEQSIQLEPHYARGSGGAGPDAHIVKAEYARQLPVCTAEKISASREVCAIMVRDCFPSDLAIQLQNIVCDRISCHGKMHQFFNRHWYTWRDEWDDHYHDHKIGWIGMLLVVGLVVYYLSFLVDRWLSDSFGSGQRGNIDGRRLLQKRNNRSKPSSSIGKWFKRSTAKAKSN